MSPPELSYVAPVVEATDLVVAEPAWLEEAARPQRGRPRSLIAGANALMRMKESARPEASRILSDPWAGSMARGDLLLAAIRFGRYILPPLWRAIDELQTAHCVRHRSIDELVLASVERDGFDQVVVVGAGYDMRPSRFANRLQGVDWYEVDLPAIGAHKRALVDRHADTSRAVRYVAADMNRQSLLERLGAHGFNPARPTLFIMEGLIHYLKKDALDALLAEVGRGPGRRRAVMSFIRPEIYKAAAGPLVSLFRVMREVPRLTFSWSQLAGICRAQGLGAFRAYTYADQVARFAPEARGRRVGSAQDVAVAEGA